MAPPLVLPASGTATHAALSEMLARADPAGNERSELALEVRLNQGLRRVTDQGDFQNRSLTLFVSVPF